MIQEYNNYYYINSNYAAGYTISEEPCVLKAIVVNVATACTIGIIDNTSGTTVNVAKLWKNATSGSYLYNCLLTTGLRIVVNGASSITPDITVVWRR